MFIPLLLGLTNLALVAFPLDYILTVPMAILMTLGALIGPIFVIALTIQLLQTYLLPDVHRRALKEIASLPTMSHFRRAWHNRSLIQTLDGIQITIQAWPVPEATSTTNTPPALLTRNQRQERVNRAKMNGIPRIELGFKSLMPLPYSLKVRRRKDSPFVNDSTHHTYDPTFDALFISQADSEADIFALLDEFTRSELILLAQHARTLVLEDSRLQLDFIPAAETPSLDRLIAVGVDILARLSEPQTIAARLERHLLEFPPDPIASRVLRLWLGTGPQESHRQDVLSRVIEGAEPTQALRAAQVLGPDALKQVVGTLVPQAGGLPASLASYMASEPDPHHLPLLNAWLETEQPAFTVLLAQLRLGQDVPLRALDDAYGRIKELPQRIELIRQMAEMRDVHLDAALCQLLQNPARTIAEKEALIEALGTCGTPSTLPLVRRYLDRREHERLQNTARNTIQGITARASNHVGALSLQDPSAPEGQLSLTQHSGGELTVEESSIPRAPQKESV